MKKRKIKVKVPSGRVVLRLEKKKPKIAHCKCGAILKGVPRERPYKMRNMPKTYKRPERPYGGALCTKCLRKLMIAKVRK